MKLKKFFLAVTYVLRKLQPSIPQKGGDRMTKEENLALYADTLKLDIDKRIREETEKIKTMANPEKEIERYFRHLRWRTPELAMYVRFQMLNILNLYD